MVKLDANPDFGIENTMTVDTAGAGDTNLLDSLYASESTTADPEKVTAIKDGADDKDGAMGPDGKADPTKLAGKEDKVPENIATDPTALTDFLTQEEGDPPVDETLSDVSTTATDTTEPPVDTGSDDPSADGNEIAFDSLANELANQGVFTRMEGEEESINVATPEEFLQRFKDEQQRGAQDIISNFLGQFGQDRQDAFQAIYVNGADPKEYFSQSAKIENYANMDLTVEINQEKIVRDTLSKQEWESEDIQSEIDKLKNYGDLEEASKRYHKALIKNEKKELQQKTLDAQEETQFKQAQKEKYVENVRTVLTEKLKAKEFDGIPLNMKTANELQDFLLVDKWRTESGETLTDFDKSILELKRPENHASKVKIALLLKLLESDPTLSTIQKRGVSTKSSQLFKDVARQKTTEKRTVANNKKPANSWFQK